VYLVWDVTQHYDLALSAAELAIAVSYAVVAYKYDLIRLILDIT